MPDKKWDFWYDHGQLFSERPVLTDDTNNLSRYFFIMNTFSSEIEFVSSSIKEILGYDPISFNTELVLSIIHPDDVCYCLESERKVIHFMDKLYFEDHYRFYCKYSYRVRKSNGEYVFVNQSYQAIETDSRGHMSRSLVFHDLIDGPFQRKDTDFAIIDRIKNRPVHIENHFNLTPREIEILDLIDLGRTTKEIALQLFISEHTVNTHRKKILSKTNSENFLELKQKFHAI